MKKCNKCGKRFDDDSLFCSQCGEKLVEINECPKCGSQVSPKDAFCSHCGFDLKNKKLKEKKEPKSSKTEKANKANFDLKKIKDYLPSILMFSSLGLMFLSIAFLFLPFMRDGFVPGNNYSVVGWLVTVSRSKIENLVDSNRFALISKFFLVIVTYAGTLVTLVTFFVISLIKVIKANKNKEYLNINKFLFISFAVYVSFAVFFMRFVLNASASYIESINGWIIFVPSLMIISLIALDVLAKLTHSKLGLEFLFVLILTISPS